MIDLVAYYSQVVSNMKQDLEWMAFDKTTYPKDKVYKRHVSRLIKSRTKDLNRTTKKLEKLKAQNKPLDPFDYCEGVSEEQKQAIRNSPTALEKVTHIAEQIHNSPFKHTHVWCVTKTNVIFTKCKNGKFHAACNRYLAYPNTGILVAHSVEM